MAITHPRLPPLELIQEMELFLDWESAGYLNKTRGGGTDYFQDAPVLWNCFLRPIPLDKDQWAEWRAWFDSMEGGMYGFLAYDFHRPRPRAHPVTFPSGYSGQSAATNITARAITSGSMPSGFQMRPGDLLGIEKGGTLWSLHEATETSNSAGGSLTTQVLPPVPTNIFTLPATIVYLKPKCVFTVDYSSIPRGETPGYNSTKFRGEQRPF